MDKIKAVGNFLSKPLDFAASIVAKYPKGALIVWAITLVIARVF